MPNVSHNTLTGTELHEPKGIASANANDVYVADGLGSGSWNHIFQFAGLHTFESDAVTVSTIGTTPQTFPFSNNGPADTLVPDQANNRITCTDAGTYYVHFICSFASVAAGDAGLYEFKLMDDGVATGYAAARTLSGANDQGNCSITALVTVGAGSQITVEVESDDGTNTDDISIYTAKLIVLKVD